MYKFLTRHSILVLTLSIAALNPGTAIAQSIEPRSAETVVEETRQRMLAEQDKLRLETTTLELKATQLETKKRIRDLEQQQSGISDTTKPRSLTESGTNFTPSLNAIPIESKILVFQSSSEVADVIAREILTVSETSEIKSIVVYSQQEFAKVNGYRLYSHIRKGIVAAYQEEGIRLTPPKVPGGPTRELGGPSSPLQGSTTVLKSVAELLSYFRSQDSISLNDYNPGNPTFIVAQLVSALRQKKSAIKVYAPSIYLTNFDQLNNPIEVFLADLNELALLKTQALKQMNTIGDPQKIQRLIALNIQADSLLNLLKDTESPMETLKTEKREVSNGSQIFQLIQGAQISELLNSRDKRVLVVDLLASGGSTRTRKSLFTSIFTGQSVSYSGGVAVQYFLVNPDNSFAAGDVIYRNSGFKSMRGATGN